MAHFPFFIYFFVILTIGIGRGSSFLFVHTGLEYAHPVNVITWRLIFAGIAALIYILLKYNMNIFYNLKSYFAPSLILSLAGIIIPFYLTAYGQVYVESGVAGVLTATTPIIGAVIIALHTKTKVTSLKYLIIGFIGVSLICINRGLNYSYYVGIVLIIGSAVSYAINNVLIGNIKSDLIDKKLLACIVLIVSSIISFIISIFFVDENIIPSIEIVQIGAILGLFCTTIPVILLFHAINKYGAVRGSIAGYLLPIVSLFLGVTFLNEEFIWIQGFGIFAILVAIYGYAKNK